VEDIPILGRDDPAEILKRFFANYDAPAYARRARAVEDAYDQLIRNCHRRRDELIQLVRLRLGVLKALAGRWEALQPLLGNEHAGLMRELHDELDPVLKVPVAPTPSCRVLSRALCELRASIERFNRRWHGFLESVDLKPINELRDGYNRYYLLEKECAMRSARLARQGFRRLAPLTVAHLATVFPLLPVPRLQNQSAS
jgi:hypothetical protein